MPFACHRCGQELPGEVVRGFCLQCGAPQIVLGSELAEQSGAEGETTGALPPPRPQRIRWGVAVPAAGAVAAAVVCLFAVATAVPLLGALGLLLLLVAGALGVGVYRQRAGATASMDSGIGAQVGLMTGLLLVGLLAAGTAGAGALARYRLHAMGPFDAQMAAQMSVLEGKAAEQARAQGEDPAVAMAELRKPEFQAGVALGTGAMLAAVLLLVSAGAGAVAGSVLQGRVQ